MFVCLTLLFCFLSFQSDFQVSGCNENCEDKPVLNPSRLVVKFGDPFSVTCSVCQHACNDSRFFDVEAPVGVKTNNESAVFWTVDQMTEWDISPSCYYTIRADNSQCCSPLPVTVYKPPSAVSFSFVNHTGAMVEGLQYTLQCTVEDVAPVKNLIVTFYRGQTALDQLQSSKTTQTPETETFTLSITASKEDNRVQYWCEAKLDLGPEGPQPPPVVISQKTTATVHYKPVDLQQESSHPDSITIKEGEPLSLDCSTAGNPRPSYAWTLPSSRPFNSSILTIDAVTSADGGQYICFVMNAMGNITVKFDVVVQGVEPTPTTFQTKPPVTARAPTIKTTTVTARAPAIKTTTVTARAPTIISTNVRSSSSKLRHGFITCCMLLFSALV